MNPFRIRIVLLSLGVVLGYGSAIAHFAHHRHHGYGSPWHHHHWADCDDEVRGPPKQ